MEKILTVSIAAYNVSDYIQEALMPFLAVRNPERLEVLIIDDGATDDTLIKAKEYEKKYPQIFRTIHKDNGGWGSTVTIGIQKATGKYFKLLDGDDFLNSKDLSYFLDELEKCDADMVVTSFVRFYDKSDKIERVDNPFYNVDRIEEFFIDSIPTTPYSLEMYALTFKTKLLQEANIQITEHCFYTDNEYVVKACNVCNTAVKMPFDLYRYRLARPGQSVSIEGMKKHYKEFEKILKKMLIFTRDNVDNSNLKKIFYERYRGLSYYYFEMLLLMGNDKKYKKSLRNYDIWLKKEFPEIYQEIRYIPLWILRHTKYIGYSLVRKWK